MAVTAWGQVYIQAVMPSEDPVQVGSLWVDTSGSAILKVCTSVSPYTFAVITGGALVNGDYGDITVSGAGTTFTIDADAVTNTKLRDSSACSVIGRSANSTGDPADISAASDNEFLRRRSNVLGFGGLLATDIPLVFPCQGRLTLTSGTAITTSDVTGATTIYFTPYDGNLVSLYDGAAWVTHSFTERSLALGTLTADLPYDVFLYNNAGTLTLEFTAWTNSTTRATALVLQDGVYVKSGATTRRYLGTFYTTSTTATENSKTKRYLWNYYNRVDLVCEYQKTTDTWTYGTATWRQADADATAQVEVVIGVQEVELALNVYTVGSSGGTNGEFGWVAVGEDSTTAPMAVGCFIGFNKVDNNNSAQFISAVRKVPSIGRHRYVWLEYVGNSLAGSTITFYGDAGLADEQFGGIIGTIQG